jgi:prepilin-type N-terminal cleavage/methylation domain-containing protein
MRKRKLASRGFSLVELLVGTILFTIVTGIAFSLLMSAQLRYQGESTVTEAFQQANVALDQIVRDVHSAGYPPISSLSATVASNPANAGQYALPFAWAPKYPATPCTVGVGGTCTIPGEYDLIVEADLGNGQGVQWIRYSLQGTTLMRGVAKKVGTDPVGSTDSQLVSYLENVMNGSNSLPIFSYACDGAPKPQPCAGASTQTPSSIRDVNISLMVQSLQPDPQTHQYRTIVVTGQAARFNPSQ